MTQIPLSALLCSWTPSLLILAGLLAFAILALAAIAWLTAAPAKHRPSLPAGRSVERDGFAPKPGSHSIA
jgi:hypothetical protein